MRVRTEEEERCHDSCSGYAVLDDLRCSVKSRHELRGEQEQGQTDQLRQDQAAENAKALTLKLDGADAVRMKWDVDAIS